MERRCGDAKDISRVCAHQQSVAFLFKHSGVSCGKLNFRSMIEIRPLLLPRTDSDSEVTSLGDIPAIGYVPAQQLPDDLPGIEFGEPLERTLNAGGDVALYDNGDRASDVSSTLYADGDVSPLATTLDVSTSSPSLYADGEVSPSEQTRNLVRMLAVNAHYETDPPLVHEEEEPLLIPPMHQLLHVEPPVPLTPFRRTFRNAREVPNRGDKCLLLCENFGPNGTVCNRPCIRRCDHGPDEYGQSAHYCRQCWGSSDHTDEELPTIRGLPAYVREVANGASSSSSSTTLERIVLSSDTSRRMLRGLAYMIPEPFARMLMSAELLLADTGATHELRAVRPGRLRSNLRKITLQTATGTVDAWMNVKDIVFVESHEPLVTLFPLSAYIRELRLTWTWSPDECSIDVPDHGKVVLVVRGSSAYIREQDAEILRNLRDESRRGRVASMVQHVR